MDIRNIIKRPIVTEKAVLMKEKSNKYTFVVDKSANKFQIKYAVETLFNVKVKSVHTSNCVGKSLKVGRYAAGYRSDWKKAIVKLGKGQEIQLADKV
ncbi:50S ribosomal protein L23 [Endomicrobiia bacterium]|uniref:Large ribosomal subunit protein uL23 n=1 Tax=Endomicrobium trichonymphae TaxID=1408204 RepID=RL23_ENDTX|nr:50S ribosomal protein L23 [Candidatus Endomicrobium trichonymphae]B1GZ85.1 RecName: Full=Large ribosomal subunit protein uL23; AltName: Full=50S ribosomal protein L23 [Candidatus Endomicrobium trichonymphae]GHT10098.1 50S ribosomal protein L23 [Endomicrobiia bacterium]BAG13567.1 50S ribosomal protein L23 [Candidatus Endomicrobium trichonymphae]GHT17217.1 50S ribosomal protein L23 [Endomicrobiia bacterium]GMO52679.1 MAG: 50S ribosomal protein L23 [Candidatus Endomicrobium trichonymphae]